MKTRDRRLANLRPFKKGQSGNPKGRPQKRPISERYAEIAEMLLDEKSRKRLKLPKGATWGDAVALVQFRVAAGLSMRGLTRAIREIREAIEGKATARFEISGPGGAEVTTRNRSLDDLLRIVQEIYGLGDPGAATKPEEHAEAVSLSGEVVQGSEPEKVRS